MRLVAISAVLVCAVAHAGLAEGVTIVLEFQEPQNQLSIAEMKREFAGIMKDSALTFDFKSRAEAGSLAFSNLVVVRLKGTCVLKPIPYLYDERGPLAFTYSAEGEVLPFAEVKCDQLTRSVQSAMSGSDFARADLLMGRALGRVLAHEVIHMLARSRAHGHDGVGRAALSGAQLIAPRLHLAPADLDRLVGPAAFASSK